MRYTVGSNDAELYSFLITSLRQLFLTYNALRYYYKHRKHEDMPPHLVEAYQAKHKELHDELERIVVRDDLYEMRRTYAVKYKGRELNQKAYDRRDQLKAAHIKFLAFGA